MKKLFSNVDFWVALITLFVLIVGVFIPGYALDVPHTAGLAAISAGYLISLAIAPAAFSWGSRKFWLTVLSFIYVLMDSFHAFPGVLDVGSLALFVTGVAIYLVGLAKDPGNGWAGLMVSRKFWGFLGSIAMILMRAYNVVFPSGITVDQLAIIISGLWALILKAAFGKDIQPVPDVDVPDDTGAAAGAG
ncbi:hypothetical protein hrd7_25270 [Leptolinea sp. HRD-7]|nr:hypothetical protein hrd7_25270 [Leptolinea sp. HRD-7]